jgi:hypothetical protein
MVKLKVKFESTPKSKLEDFLKLTMKFKPLFPSDDFCTTTNIEMMETDDDAYGRTRSKDSFFFYCDDNYFKGTMVRLKVIDRLNATLKVYIR